MVRLTLDINKAIEQNASVYFEKSKKAKRKLEGAKEAIKKTKKQIEKLKKDRLVEEKKEVKKKQDVKKEWYEKFRWFISSEGFLVIGGRDATTNEIVIKKHTDKEDIVFHTDMAGSPFFVIKSEDKKIGEETLKEVADATLSYSKAWKAGLTSTEVFYVKPDQVSKKAQPGEFLPKGAFMIRGKTTYIPADMNIAIGILKNEKIMGGPLDAIKKNCEKFIEIQQGNEKTGAVAKKIQKKVGGDLDEIIRATPAGGVKVKK
jgi:predicted ribosome quality control (RQC) complex YloA/Tae2 family protein